MTRRALRPEEMDAMRARALLADLGPRAVARARAFALRHGLSTEVVAEILRARSELAGIGFVADLEEIARRRGLLGPRGDRVLVAARDVAARLAPLPLVALAIGLAAWVGAGSTGREPDRRVAMEPAPAPYEKVSLGGGPEPALEVSEPVQRQTAGTTPWADPDLFQVEAAPLASEAAIRVRGSCGLPGEPVLSLEVWLGSSLRARRRVRCDDSRRFETVIAIPTTPGHHRAPAGRYRVELRFQPALQALPAGSPRTAGCFVFLGGEDRFLAEDERERTALSRLADEAFALEERSRTPLASLDLEEWTERSRTVRHWTRSVLAWEAGLHHPGRFRALLAYLDDVDRRVRLRGDDAVLRWRIADRAVALAGWTANRR